MKEEHSNDAVLRLLRLLAESLDHYLDGDETALETLGELIDQAQFSTDEVQSAILVLRTLGGSLSGSEAATVETAPGKNALRILSAEEREMLSPEAWGYLIDLRRRGSLDSGQFERVLDILPGYGVRPIGIDLAREVAARVALQFDPADVPMETGYGDHDITH